MDWFFWVTTAPDLCGSGVAVWLGPALTKLLVMGVLRGVFPPEGCLSEGSGGLGPVFLPVF